MYQLVPPLAAYPYVQYNDDDNIVAFFKAYNAIAQEYVDYFNNYNLADYYSELLTGDLLDWCATGIYGIPRPFIVVGEGGETYGPYGDGFYGEIAYGLFDEDVGTSVTYYFVSDDVYRRVLTWNFFKGDGNQFNIEWLKRRVARFLTGNLYPEQTYDYAVIQTDGNAVEIDIPASDPLADTLEALVNSNILTLPFQYVFTVAQV